MKVAIIGDSTVERSTAIQILKDSDVDVIVVEDSSTAIQNLKDSDVDVIVVDNPSKIFELNGETFTSINPPKHMNTLRDSLLKSLSMLDNIYVYDSSYYERKLSPDIDIIKEYGLIKNKKSNLSKWERDMVVYTFEKTYKKINP